MGLGIQKRIKCFLAIFEALLFYGKNKTDKAHIQTITTNECGKWFICEEEIRSCISKYMVSVAAGADSCIKHQFDILGTGMRDWGDPICWHQDILAKKVWGIQYYKRLLYCLRGFDGSDVKIPWELSRFQHVMPLVQAYVTSKDNKYAEEAKKQICNWIYINPFLYGVNWLCAMEVAIRACNWIWAWWAFRDNPAWKDKFNERFLKSIWQHGWYIEHNLENKGGIRTNHYLSDIVGLLFIAIMFPQFKDSERWRKFGVSQVVHCMEEMVYPDGVSFENSTAYQRLVLELFTYSAILCQRNGIELPHRFWERLEKMFEFIMYCIRPDGRMPMVGDSDDGRFFIFSNYSDWDRWDFRYLLSIGAVLHNRRDFKDAAGKCYGEVAWLFGRKGIDQWQMI